MTIKVSDLGQMAFFDNITFIIMVANLNQISRIFCLHGLNYSSHSLFARFATTTASNFIKYWTLSSCGLFEINIVVCNLL